VAEDKERVVRDPIHGYIDLSDQEVSVIDTGAFQRLRRIKQVAHTYLVYPSAIHTRFTHSIGTMHIAGLMADRLALKPVQVKDVRLAALLHDIGHGPFSHLFEGICNSACGKALDHEDVGLAIIRSDPALRQALGAHRGRVLEILSGDGGIMSRIISGGLDSDKMDYFRRDSFHAGVRYGEYDFDRILRTIKPKGEHIYVPKKGVDAIDGFLLAREQLYLQVYNHHTRLIADEMLKRVVELAVKTGHLDRSWFRFDSGHPREFLARFMKWGDLEFMSMLHERATGNAKELLDDLEARRLLKRGYDRDMGRMPAIPTGRLSSGGTELQDLERHLSRSLRIPAHRIFAKIVSISMKQYYLNAGEELLAENEDGEIVNFLDISKLTGPSTDLQRFLVFGPRGEGDRIHSETVSFLETLT
jgi:uncharacterized protein